MRIIIRPATELCIFVNRKIIIPSLHKTVSITPLVNRGVLMHKKEVMPSLTAGSGVICLGYTPTK